MLQMKMIPMVDLLMMIIESRTAEWKLWKWMENLTYVFLR